MHATVHKGEKSEYKIGVRMKAVKLVNELLLANCNISINLLSYPLKNTKLTEKNCMFSKLFLI